MKPHQYAIAAGSSPSSPQAHHGVINARGAASARDKAATDLDWKAMRQANCTLYGQSSRLMHGDENVDKLRTLSAWGPGRHGPVGPAAAGSAENRGHPAGWCYNPAGAERWTKR